MSADRQQREGASAPFPVKHMLPPVVAYQEDPYEPNRYRLTDEHQTKWIASILLNGEAGVATQRATMDYIVECLNARSAERGNGGSPAALKRAASAAAAALRAAVLPYIAVRSMSWSDWSLYAPTEARNTTHAAAMMSAEVEDALNAATDPLHCWEVVAAILVRYERFGAFDTEPRAIARGLIARRFGAFLSPIEPGSDT